VKRKLEAGNLLVARVGPDHVTKYKHWGTTADRDVVVRVDFNIQVPDEAIHKPLLGALKGTHPSMRRESALPPPELLLTPVSPRLKA
jgi:hypothetical protein